jgi:hypothetical protein
MAMLKAFNSQLGHEKLWKDRKPSGVMPTIPHLEEPEKRQHVSKRRGF